VGGGSCQVGDPAGNQVRARLLMLQWVQGFVLPQSHLCHVVPSERDGPWNESDEHSRGAGELRWWVGVCCGERSVSG